MNPYKDFGLMSASDCLKPRVIRDMAKWNAGLGVGPNPALGGYIAFFLLVASKTALASAMSAMPAK